MPSHPDYYEVTIVAEGAVDEVHTVYGSVALFLDDIVRSEQERPEAERCEQIEIFVQYHGHPDDVEECACAQYEQSHLPRLTLHKGVA